jgi:hypothetical protein
MVASERTLARELFVVTSHTDSFYRAWRRDELTSSIAPSQKPMSDERKTASRNLETECDVVACHVVSSWATRGRRRAGTNQSINPIPSRAQGAGRGRD